MPESPPKREIAVIAQEIRNYLAKHPNAADGLEGVVKWWLMRQRYEDSLINVQKALEHLIATGVMVKCCQPDGRVIYSSVRNASDRE